jgi:hypothetical protein
VDSGAVMPRMFDESGQIQVKLGADEGGSGLVLLNEQTDPGIQPLSSAGTTGVTRFHAEGNERVFTR